MYIYTYTVCMYAMLEEEEEEEEEEGGRALFGLLGRTVHIF